MLKDHTFTICRFIYSSVIYEQGHAVLRRNDVKVGVEYQIFGNMPSYIWIADPTDDFLKIQV
jgi:hypothetical protein